MRAQRTFTSTIAVVTLAFLALLGTGSHNLRTGIHVVKAGETLAELAAHYGTTPSALAKANGITNPNHIVAGSHLTIPERAGEGSPRPAPRTGSARATRSARSPLERARRSPPSSSETASPTRT